MNRKPGTQTQAIPILFLALAFLVFGAGCTGTADTGMPENVTPTPAVLHYERGMSRSRSPLLRSR